MTSLKQIQNTLRLTFVIVPIVAGLDKFTNLLANWPGYLGANITGMLPVNAMVFMKIVGVIEIAAGIIVLLRPLIGAYIVMVWLICIALQLIIGGHYFDGWLSGTKLWLTATLALTATPHCIDCGL